MRDSTPTDGENRRDYMKLGLFAGLTGLLGVSTEEVLAADVTQGSLQAEDVESMCVFQGPLDNGVPAKDAPKGCAYCYIEYTDGGGPGAMWISTQDISGWELLHSTTQEVRLEDRSDGSNPEVGIINEGETLYKVTYE